MSDNSIIGWIVFMSLVLLNGCASTVQGTSGDARALGKAALEEGRVTEAISLLEPLVAEEASPADLRVLGEAYLRLGKGEKGFSMLMRALEMGGGDGPLFRLIGRAAALSGRVEAGIDFLERGTNETDVPVYSLWELARLYLDVDRSGAALRVARRIVAMDPDGSEGFALLAQSAILAGNDEEGLAAMTRAIQLAPVDPHMQFRMGNIWLSKGHVETAAVSYRKALELEPNHPDASRALGSALLLLGQYREAIQLLEKALQYAPDSPEIHNSLGIAFTEVGIFEEAAKNLERGLELAPEAEALYSNLAEVRLREGEVKEAIQVIQAGTKAIRDQPGAGVRFHKVLRRLRVVEAIVSARCAGGEDIVAIREHVIRKLGQDGDFRMEEITAGVMAVQTDAVLRNAVRLAVSRCP